MLRYLYITSLVVLFTLNASDAQGQLKRKPNLRRPVRGSSETDASNNQRNDFEGAVWEYKVIDRNEKDRSNKPYMTGRLRVKQSALFPIGKVEVNKQKTTLSAADEAANLMKKYDRDGNNQLSTSELTAVVSAMRTGAVSVGGNQANSAGKARGKTSQGIKGDLESLMSQRLRDAKRSDTGGGARIGDVSKKGAREYVFQFDQDDDYPLSGRAELKPDTKKKGGVFKGNYWEYVNGKKGERWHIEMRKIDE